MHDLGDHSVGPINRAEHEPTLCDLHVDAMIRLLTHPSRAVSDLRYMELPARPPGTEQLNERELAELVNRDAMIGVAVVRMN